jgi:hypothetical protein
LTRTDVKQLASAGSLEEKVDFWEQSLIYAIQLTDDEQLSASFKSNVITLFMPKFMIGELDETDKVGFENNESQLHLLVEKDFTCLDNVAEDQSDNYPNPLVEKFEEK